jgi:sulfate permease, SulP family
MKERILKFFPFVNLVSGYSLGDLRWDLLAGTTLAFYAIPTSMAYASLAGLPPETGIYCYLFAGLLYFIFGTSRQLAIGPTSAISIVVASSVGVLAGGDPAKAVVLASLTALLMAGFFLLAWIIRLSSLISFISDTILVGFKAGAAMVIASTQLPKLFGIKAEGSSFFERIWDLLNSLGGTRPVVLILGLAAFALLLTGNYFFRGKPVSLLIVIGSILLVTFTGVGKMGIDVVGEIPRGIPVPGISFIFDAKDFNDIFFLAMACFFLSYVESISAARAIARDHDYEVDPRQELLALGAANLAASLGHGYAVAGGLSQSRVNDKAGAKTLVSLLFTSLILGMSLLFLTGLFKNLPHVILAVIVLDAVIGLIDLKELKHLFSVSRSEFWVATITILAVMVLGVLQGIVIAVILSIITILKKTATPHIAVLGIVPGTKSLSDITRHPDNILIDKVLILRPEVSILYFNTNHIREDIRKRMEVYGRQPKLVILDLSSANFVDVAGARFILQFEEELKNKGIMLRIVDALGSVRDILRAEGLEKAIGHISRRISLHDVLEDFQSGRLIADENQPELPLASG